MLYVYLNFNLTGAQNANFDQFFLILGGRDMKGLHFSIRQSILNRLTVYYRVDVEDVSVPRSSKESNVISTSFC